jgi:hypothetical protein
MSLFFLPKVAPVSGGESYPGAKLYFYATGTTNAANVYTDSALTTAHAVPVTADSGGVFAPIYVDSSLSYRVVLKNSAGSTVWDVDPFPAAFDDAASVGAVLWPRTTAEIAASVTPSDYAYPVSDVRRYGADPTGTNSSQIAVDRAIDVALAQTGGGTVYFPTGIYKVTSIDLSNVASEFDQTIRLVGDGRFNTKITPAAAGNVLLNGIGRNYFTVEGIHFHSGDYESQCAIFLARSTTSGNCNNNHFRDIWVTGNYTYASVVTVAAESMDWFNCRFENTNASAEYCTFWTGTDNSLIGVTITGQSAIVGPNTDNNMIDCEFYSPFAGAEIVKLSRGANFNFFGCLFIGGAAVVKCVVYKDPDTNRWNGPANYYGCQFEFQGGGSGACHYLDASGTDFFDGINTYGGHYVLDDGTSIIDYDRTAVAKQPILEGSVWTNFKTATGNTSTYVYLYGVYSCDICFRPRATEGTLVITGLAESSRLEATYLVAPSVFSNGIATRAASAIPTSGTFGKGMVIYNNAPAVGQPSAWVCTVSGTLGTLNSGSTTGDITSGSNVLTVNSATGLVAGVNITIGGVTGAKTVSKVSGTTVYLTSNADATVTTAAVAYSNATLTAMANLA